MALKSSTPEEWGDDAYFCATCGARFRSPSFDIAREFERTIFYEHGRDPEVEIIGSETIGQFCSEHCRSESRDALLRKEDVRATHPGIGPLEFCSRCKAPVDMTRFHLTYVEYSLSGDWGSMVAHTSDVVPLAIVCNKCVPPQQRLISGTS